MSSLQIFNILIISFTFSCSVISYHLKSNQIKFHSSIRSKPDNGLGGDIITKSIFSFTEAFGWLNSIGSNTISNNKLNKNIKSIDQKDKIDLQIISKQILDEYKAIFWATGNMDISLWADNCTFADPFSSFGGKGSTLRFKSNADNLGKLVIDPNIKILFSNIDLTLYTITIGWNFRSKLNLPWKPILAASGFTTHYIDKNNGLIYKYEERWKSKPFDVIKRLLVPSSSASTAITDE